MDLIICICMYVYAMYQCNVSMYLPMYLRIYLFTFVSLYRSKDFANDPKDGAPLFQLWKCLVPKDIICKTQARGTRRHGLLPPKPPKTADSKNSWLQSMDFLFLKHNWEQISAIQAITSWQIFVVAVVLGLVDVHLWWKLHQKLQDCTNQLPTKSCNSNKKIMWEWMAKTHLLNIRYSYPRFRPSSQECYGTFRKCKSISTEVRPGRPWSSPFGGHQFPLFPGWSTKNETHELHKASFGAAKISKIIIFKMPSLQLARPVCWNASNPWPLVKCPLGRLDGWVSHGATGLHPIWFTSSDNQMWFHNEMPLVTLKLWICQMYPIPRKKIGRPSSFHVEVERSWNNSPLAMW